jgi:hypothetical protein
MGPLIYLTLCSFRNRALVRFRRLKEPRYFIGTLVGLAYFWFVFWRPRSYRRQVPQGWTSMMGATRLPVELAGAAVLFLVSAASWILPGRQRPALFFSQSDVQFLFPAPLTRRQLVHYKLLRSQLSVLIGSAFMTLLFRPSSLLNSWMFFFGMALTMTILNLHLTGVSLSRESLSAHGGQGFARQWVPLGLFVAAISILIGTVMQAWPTLSALGNGRDFITEMGRLASTGAAGVVLWPFRAVVRLPLSETPAAFLQALPWGLLILVLNYVWVLRSDAKFEEASADLAEKIANLQKGRQGPAPKLRAATSTPFTLSLEGRPETAILWKNLIFAGRYLSVRTLLRFLPMVIVFAIFARGRGAGGANEGLAVLCIVAFIFTILLGPQFARNDLRQDFANLAVLKAWPIDGATLVRGEVMAPAALLTAIAWLASIGALVFAKGVPFLPSWVLAAIFVAPGMIILQLLAQNAIAVLWPSWVATGNTRARGIDVMGQRLIMMAGFLLVLVVAVLPAAIVAMVVRLAIYFLTGTSVIILPAAVAAIVLFAESFVASHAIGKVLERMDVSAIDAPE